MLCPAELTLIKAHTNYEHYPFLNLDLYIFNGKLNTNIYIKRDDFSFPIVNYPFYKGDVPLSPSYGVYIFQLVRFALVCNNAFDLNGKLLHRGFRYHKLVNTFTLCYHQYKDILA